MKPQEIVPGIHQVPDIPVNAYLIDRDELTLIDTGIRGNGNAIISYIIEVLGRRPEDLKYIIITHYHQDHTGSAYDLADRTGAQVAIHEADAGYLSGAVAPPPLRGIRGTFIGILMALMPAMPCTPDILLHDGDRIRGLECIHTPGHTPGSICLFDPVSGVLFAGDAITTKKGVIGRPPASGTLDMVGAMASIRKIEQPGLTAILSGHGSPVTTWAGEKLEEFIQSKQN